MKPIVALSTVAGLTLALPYVLFQLLAFVLPGLTSKHVALEKEEDKEHCITRIHE